MTQPESTFQQAIEVDSEKQPPKAKRYTHAILDVLGRSQRDLARDVGRSKCYTFVALLSVAVLLGAMVTANVVGYEIVKETKVKGGRLETRNGEAVKVALVGDTECPLVELLQKTTEELANEKLVVFSATDPDDKIWTFTIKVADTATYLDPLSMLTNYFSQTLIISTFGGGKLELTHSSVSDDQSVYRGTFMDNFHCKGGCVVHWCDDVMTDDYSDPMDTSYDDLNSVGNGGRRNLLSIDDYDGQRKLEEGSPPAPSGAHSPAPTSEGAPAPAPFASYSYSPPAPSGAPSYSPSAPSGAPSYSTPAPSGAPSAEGAPAPAPTQSPTTKSTMCNKVNVAKLNDAQPFQVYMKKGVYHMHKLNANKTAYELKPGTYDCKTKVGAFKKQSPFNKGEVHTCKEWANKIYGHRCGSKNVTDGLTKKLIDDIYDPYMTCGTRKDKNKETAMNKVNWKQWCDC